MPSEGSRVPTSSHCHAVQEMYDKTLLTIRIKREKFGWRNSDLCMKALHFVCKKVVVIRFAALKCLVVFDHILKHNVPCAPTHFAAERYCKTSSSNSIIHRSVGSTTRGLHCAPQRNTAMGTMAYFREHNTILPSLVSF